MGLPCIVHVACVICVLSDCNWVRYPGSGYVCVDKIDGLVSSFVLSGSYEQCAVIPASTTSTPSTVSVTPIEPEHMPYVRIGTIVLCVVAAAFCVFPIERMYRIWRKRAPTGYWIRTTTENTEEVDEYMDMTQFNQLQDSLDRTIVPDSDPDVTPPPSPFLRRPREGTPFGTPPPPDLHSTPRRPRSERYLTPEPSLSPIRNASPPPIRLPTKFSTRIKRNVKTIEMKMRGQSHD